MTWHFSYHAPSLALGWCMGDNQCVTSSALLVSRWLWPGNKTFLEVSCMVVTWWIVAFLQSVSTAKQSVPVGTFPIRLCWWRQIASLIWSSFLVERHSHLVERRDKVEDTVLHVLSFLPSYYNFYTGLFIVYTSWVTRRCPGREKLFMAFLIGIHEKGVDLMDLLRVCFW